MELKKNPKYDVHRQRGTIFQISLAITLALVLTAFKWSVPVEKEAIADSGPAMTYSPIEDFIPSTIMKSDEPPKARELKPEKIIPIEFVPIMDEPIVSSDPSTSTIDQGKPIDNSSPFGSIELTPEAVIDTIFYVVEKMPEPVGGFEGFYKTLSKIMKYPKRANWDHVIGKVFISFVVNEKSELSDFKVLKGIGSGCDEEAIRVIALSKWNSGKQRGRPVKVRMVQTINFQLN